MLKRAIKFETRLSLNAVNLIEILRKNFAEGRHARNLPEAHASGLRINESLRQSKARK